MNELIRIQSALLAIIAQEQKQTQQEKTSEDKLLDAQDVMQLLHISPRTLFRYRQKGTLAFQKVEGKIYYTKAAIMDLIKSI